MTVHWIVKHSFFDKSCFDGLGARLTAVDCVSKTIKFIVMTDVRNPLRLAETQQRLKNLTMLGVLQRVQAYSAKYLSRIQLIFLQIAIVNAKKTIRSFKFKYILRS